VKVEFDIPDQLYKKFQAAMVIKEENEDEVMCGLISDYLKKLFGVPESPKATRPEIPEGMEKKQIAPVDSYSQKRAFVEWFKEQTYRGRPYNPVTISGYSGRIENACQSPEFGSVPINNLFEITDVDEFHVMRLKIERCEGFQSFDAASHNGFTAALNMYERFLCTKNGSDDYRAVHSGIEREGHRWTYAEDELCCKRFFDVFVINKRNIDLTRFAEALHQELPAISVGSLKMKAQNIKCLCEIEGIACSLSAKSLNQYSAQCKKAFSAVRSTYQI